MTIPEGRRCATCKREHSGCSDLDFKGMKVISKTGDVTIVKCSEWEKKK